MPTTTNRSYVTDPHGAGINVWDGTLNTVFNQIDQNFGAVSNVALSNVNVLLNAAQYVCGSIRFSGTLTGNVVVTFPSVSGWWTVINDCTGGFFVQLTCGAGNRICAPPGEAVDICTDGSNMRYRNLGRVGSYLDFALSVVPSWINNCTIPPYLLCDGSAFSAVTYPLLAAVLGGTTLPDARGRTRFAVNSGTGRLTAVGGIDGNTMLAAGGVGTGLTIAQVNLPAATLATTIIDPGHTHPSIGAGFVHVGAPLSLNLPGPGGNAGSNSVTASNSTGITASTALGGSGTPLASVSPGYVGGITLIRAA